MSNRSKRDSPGRRLMRLCAEAHQEVVLVAPFVKVGALRRLLEAIGEGVRVRCVTRWHPQEIAAGVSDLAVWPLLRERPRASLSLQDDLHAKYYRVDDSCLVGSANLTGAALGWSNAPNLELLVSRPARTARLASFERALMRSCSGVDDDFYRQLEHMLRQLEAASPRGRTVEGMLDAPADSMVDDSFAEEEKTEREQWVPALRHPEDLYRFYCGEAETLTSAARRAAARDLAALSLPPGLPEDVFGLHVAWHLLQKPTVRAVDAFLAEPRRFGAVRRFLRERFGASTPDFDATRAWQTLMRWLLHFRPERYERTMRRHTEVVRRVEREEDGSTRHSF